MLVISTFLAGSNFTALASNATSFPPIPRKPPTSTLMALGLPMLSNITSSTEPTESPFKSTILTLDKVFFASGTSANAIVPDGGGVAGAAAVAPVEGAVAADITGLALKLSATSDTMAMVLPIEIFMVLSILVVSRNNRPRFAP